MTRLTPILDGFWFQRKTHRVLLPMDNKVTKYIMTTHNNIAAYEQKLVEMSACYKVRVRSIPQGEIDENEYEEFILDGAWFSVANLEYVILQPDFRDTVIEEFDTVRRRNLPTVIDE